MLFTKKLRRRKVDLPRDILLCIEIAPSSRIKTLSRYQKSKANKLKENRRVTTVPLISNSSKVTREKFNFFHFFEIFLCLGSVRRAQGSLKCTERIPIQPLSLRFLALILRLCQQQSFRRANLAPVVDHRRNGFRLPVNLANSLGQGKSNSYRILSCRRLSIALMSVCLEST